MKYFKNTELAKLYSVSEKSVRNWIEAAQAGKLDLKLYEHSGRNYIANTSHNNFVVEELVQKGKKYKNTRGFKTVTPAKEFYDQYSPNQIFDIISNIDVYREVPYEYSYFGEGAHLWDEYTRKQLLESSPNSLTNTIELLSLSRDYLGKLLDGYAKVNVVDVGPGNGLPVRQLLSYLLERGKLNRYIAIDISQEMLTIAETSIKEWFQKDVKFEGHIRDIRHDRFDDLLAGDSFGSKADSTINIILFLGGTIANLRQPDRALANVHDSMGKNDLFILSRKLDSMKSRRYFDFVPEAGGQNHIFRGKMILDLLNIDSALYTMQQYFDAEEMSRKVEVELNVAVTIVFQFEGKDRSISLNKGDRLLLWRATHQSSLEAIRAFRSNGLDPLLVAKSKDRQYLEMVARISSEQA